MLGRFGQSRQFFDILKVRFESISHQIILYNILLLHGH